MSDIYFSDELLNLAAAVFLQAVRDAKSGDNTRSRLAQFWLDNYGISWLDALGLDGARIYAKVLSLPRSRFSLWTKNTTHPFQEGLG